MPPIEDLIEVLEAKLKELRDHKATLDDENTDEAGQPVPSDDSNSGSGVLAADGVANPPPAE